MRRAQSVRHYGRPSLALGADDLGVLKEGDESNEDVLRRQLIDKDRENDKVSSTFVRPLKPNKLTIRSCKRKFKYYRHSWPNVRRWKQSRNSRKNTRT